jgi:hypothetical protein
MKIQTRKCPTCGWQIFARTDSDSRTCDCGGITVSGRTGAVKVTWDPKLVDPSKVIVVEIETKADNKKLYDDWTSGRNRYGRIKPKTD